MPTAPQLVLQTPTDGNSVLTAGFLATLQTNIQNWGSNFLPLIGGALVGPVTWSQAQQFPAAQVVLPSNPTYPHQNIWRTVWDHIADPTIHRQAGPPQAHAASHQLAGTDPLFGNQISISATLAGTDIKTYVDSKVNAASAAATTNYAPATYYQIGGAQALLGSMIGINAGNPNTDIKTYVDGQIAALSGSYPQNATFSSVVLSATASAISFSNNSCTINSLGATVLRGDGTNFFVACRGAGGVINFGNQVTANLYGTLSAAGYTVGSTVIGPNSGVINGSLTANGDLAISRSSSALPAQGALNMGQSSAGAYLSWNADAASQFYFSKALTVAGNLTVAAGGTLTVGSLLSVTTAGLTATALPITLTNGTGVTILGQDAANGSLELRSTLAAGVPYIDFTQNSTGANTPDYTQRIQLDSGGTKLNLTGGLSIATTLSVNGGVAATTGDLGVARAAAIGQLNFGSGASPGALDYGATTGGYFTFAAAGTTLAQIKNDGTFLVGTSSFGPLGASVNGTVVAVKSIQASTGLTFAGTNGFVFTGSGAAFDTGMFSNGAADLRFFTGAGTPALTLISGAATFAGAITTSAGVNAATLTTTGNASVGGNLTLTGTLSAGTTTITKFRHKFLINLGNSMTTTATSFAYPNIVIPAYSSGTIDAVRLSAIAADGTSTQSTWQITKNGAVIATISLPNGQKTAKNFPITNPTPIAEGDQISAVCTVAGTSVGVAVLVEVSQSLY